MGSGLELGLAIVVVTFLSILVITLLVVGVIAYAFHRAMPPADDPAIAELKRRLADGEISDVEYQVHLRTLTKGD